MNQAQRTEIRTPNGYHQIHGTVKAGEDLEDVPQKAKWLCYEKIFLYFLKLLHVIPLFL